MLTTEEKRFFTGTAVGAGRLSKCSEQQGATLILGRRILSYGYNRKIIKNKAWEVSAISDTLFGARDQDITGAFLFSTYFPTIDDMKMIIVTGIIKVYFFGKVNNSDAVDLINNFNSSSNLLELIQLT